LKNCKNRPALGAPPPDPHQPPLLIEKFWVYPFGQGGWASAEISSAKGERVNYLRFCADVLYGRPLSVFHILYMFFIWSFWIRLNASQLSILRFTLCLTFQGPGYEVWIS